MQHETLDGIQKQKEDIGGKTGEIKDRLVYLVVRHVCALTHCCFAC